MSHWTYSRCALCPASRRQVMPDGYVSARIMLIGEGPGKIEDIEGIPFVGLSGQEQDQTYFSLAGLSRRDVFITNCVQCRQERNGIDIRPDPKLITSCSLNHLQEELCTVNPEVLILAGATACSLVPSIDLELEHGYPRRCDGVFGWSGWVVPMYHPAAGMHETRYMTPLLEDWERLGKWLRGEWEPPKHSSVCNYDLMSQYPYLRELLKKSERISVDTESDEGNPYSIQFSAKPGKAFMWITSMYGFPSCVRVFNEYGADVEFILHNAPYDLDVLDRMGIRVNKFRDTMQELYHLGNLPQGLKAAVYRVFGYRMTSYDEVVTPHSKAALENWLSEALAHVSLNMGVEVRTQLKTKLRVTTKPHAAEAVLRRVMSHLNSDYDPWELPKYSKGDVKFRLIGRDWLEEVEAAVGRMPRPSIIHAPLDQQIQYACSDADWTGRLAMWLDGERKRIVNNEWRVA